MRKIDWLDWIETLSDKDKRYELARKVDVLDVGSELAKSEVWRSLDFWEMLPKIDDDATPENFLENLGSKEHYMDALNELKPVSMNLANFYGSLVQVIDEHPQLADQMNRIIAYEIDFPHTDAVTAVQKSVQPIVVGSVDLNFAAKFSPDAFMQLPLVGHYDFSELIEEHMDKQM